MNVNNSNKTAIIHIDGIDAKKFLQGQLTCDLEKVHTGTWSLGAHCNPKGRIISLFHITQHNGSYLLRLPECNAEHASNALKKYAVFFKLTLQIEHDITQYSLSDDANFKRTNIHQGLPDIYRDTSEKYLPHELNLNNTEAISFDKGCYTGQEIIARMHYRGKLKNHLYKAIIHGCNFIPGQDIFSTDDNTPIGNLVDIYPENEKHSIALIITDEKTAHAVNIYINNTHIQFLNNE